MIEWKYERKLKIRTTGVREWGQNKIQYNRYEATPYQALDHFFETYELGGSDRLVDFGCGRGRVTFYLHNRFKIPVIGIEANALTYEEALLNKQSYQKIHGNIKAPIHFENVLAEQYSIYWRDTCFYFFNPFSVKIFENVIRNILISVSEHPRKVEIILYYPPDDYAYFLQNDTPFELVNEEFVPGDDEIYGKFVVYRLE